MIMRVTGNLPQQSTIVQYQADGLEDAYNFDYLVPTAADIAVYVTPVGQTPNPEIDIINPAHYAVTFADPIVNGGTVTFGGLYIPGNGTIVTLSRNMEFSLDTQFANPQNFSGQNLDDALQRLELQAQQLNTLQGQRNLSYAINSFTPPGDNNTNIPILGANQTWSKLTDDGNVVAVDISGGGDASVLRSQLASEVMSADGSLIVGYYSTIQNLGMTVHAILAQLENSIATSIPPGRTIISYANESLPWIPLNDGTVGNAASNATTRANADTINLFTLFWGKDQDIYPLFSSNGQYSGRGVSGAADFAANKAIKLGYTAGRAVGNTGQAILRYNVTTIMDSQILTVTNATIANNLTGTVIQFSNSGGTLPSGLSPSTNYYIIPVNDSSFSVATSLANAQAGTAITFGSAGSGTNTGTITLPVKIEGQFEGEYQHNPILAELMTHDHGVDGDPTIGILSNTDDDPGVASEGGAFPPHFIDEAGGGQPFNVTQPTTYAPFWIHL